MSEDQQAEMSGERKSYPIVRDYNAFIQKRDWTKGNIHNRSVGFVPTMGGLHDGHLSLIRKAAAKHDTVVISIFVNPAQFSPTEDLSAYPRTLDSDLQKIRLELPECPNTTVIVFLPSAANLYPSGITLDQASQKGAFVTVQGLSHQQEGAVRPHFFRGVATILVKLLNIVQPDVMFLGQKDIQQCIVAKRLLRDLCMDTKIEIGETVRESSGLAMSSRNVYLRPEEMDRAAILYKALAAAKEAYCSGQRRCATLKGIANDILSESVKQGSTDRIEYLCLADMEDLEELTLADTIPEDKKYVMTAALQIGKYRILDNVILE